MAEIRQITKKPQCFEAKSVEKFSKTRIKMKKYTFATLLKKKCGGYKHWYIRKVADFHKYTLLKNFLEKNFSKRYFTSKVCKSGKNRLLFAYTNESSLHVFKTENV
jgi:hypothetical protein